MVDPISIALEAAGLTAVIETGFGTVAASSIAAYAIVGGAAIGGLLLFNALQPKQHADNQITIKQATPPRVRGYGRALLGGSYFFFLNSGSTLVQGFALCEGPIDGYEEHWFNGQISADGGLLFGHPDIYPYYRQINFWGYLGATDQQVGSINQFFGFWDNTYRLRGIAYTVLALFLPGNPSKNFTKFFPSGVPSYLARLRLAQVYDPRVSAQKIGDPTTWKWSDNPALCILDYLTSSRGMGIPSSRMNFASFAAMANICDEAVALGDLGRADDMYAAGTTSESRYRLWGTYRLDEEPKAVLERMLKTCDGEIYPIADGTIGLRGGAWTPPTVTIDDSIITGLDVHRGVDKLASFNQLKIRTVSVYNQFQIVEGDPWDDVASQQASGEVLPQDFELEMVPSYTQGCRLAKIFMAKGNPAWIAIATGPLVLLQALGERTVHLKNSDFGIDEDMFVTGFEIVNEAECKISMGSLSALAYEWSIAEEQNAAAASGMTSDIPMAPPAVTGLQVTLGRTQVNSSVAAVFIQVAVTPPTDTTLSLVAEYQKHGDTAWLEMTVDDVAYTANSGILADQTSYDVRVAFSTYGGTLGPYATTSIQSVSDPNPPAQVTAFRASVDRPSGVVTLMWTTGGSANFNGVHVYRNTRDDFPSAVLFATVFGSPNTDATTTDQPKNAGDYYYYIVSFNGSGVSSGVVGPYEVTI